MGFETSSVLLVSSFGTLTSSANLVGGNLAGLALGDGRGGGAFLEVVCNGVV